MANEGLTQAIEKAGGQAALARVLARQTGRPIRQGHVWAWINRSGRVPPELVLPIESATGVSRHALRPDLYPREVRAN